LCCAVRDLKLSLSRADAEAAALDDEEGRSDNEGAMS
jgi:hypothetical protein